jgi:hypothetical protein
MNNIYLLKLEEIDELEDTLDISDFRIPIFTDLAATLAEDGDILGFS